MAGHIEEMRPATRISIDSPNNTPAGVDTKIGNVNASPVFSMVNFMIEFGPNLKKLAIHRAAQLLTPSGLPRPHGAFLYALEHLKSPAKVKNVMTEAIAWAREAVDTVKTSHDNPFPDDESIAGEILRLIQEKNDATQGKPKS